jgi:hypothetical protein
VACHPFAAHLKHGNGPELLCSDFCSEYTAACELPADYCAQHASTSGYCYPYSTATEDVVSNGAVQPYFKNIPNSNDAFSEDFAGVLHVYTCVCHMLTRSKLVLHDIVCLLTLLHHALSRPCIQLAAVLWPHSVAAAAFVLCSSRHG